MPDDFFDRQPGQETASGPPGYSPTPRPPKPPTSPWVYVVITCGVVFIVAMLVCGVFFWGAFKQLAPQMQEAQTAEQDLRQIYSAIDKFQLDNNGKWPDSLGQLVPKYIPAERKSLLIDPGKVGAKESDRLLTYYKPPTNASASYVVIEREVTGANPNLGFRLSLRKSGEVRVEPSVGRLPAGK